MWRDCPGQAKRLELSHPAPSCSPNGPGDNSIHHPSKCRLSGSTDNLTWECAYTEHSDPLIWSENVIRHPKKSKKHFCDFAADEHSSSVLPDREIIQLLSGTQLSQMSLLCKKLIRRSLMRREISTPNPDDKADYMTECAKESIRAVYEKNFLSQLAGRANPQWLHCKGEIVGSANRRS